MSNARAELAAKFRAAIAATVVRVPVSVGANEGVFSRVDNGTATQYGERHCAAKFRGGKWVRPNNTPLAFEPTFWVKLK